ncbi:NMDA receptor synaptonuclear signaling and neuronal migration factor isoform X3 [Gadus morhua]|uniref:NMDA receptor synaptonuclear signaling and neuronal migration factor isoform X3 n=1 Tax=Gadus morhua TaxID=8049 RepID=UPI0011B378A7|nr:NMDA receptor synaptonuclear signaling and neuronal migration factor-like isoform X3 [Gadus morhua]
MGTAVSKRKNLRNDAISSVAAKVRAARAFGEYLSHPENPNGSAHLLCETLVAPDTCESSTDTPRRLDNNNHLHHHLKLRPDGTVPSPRGPQADPETSLVKPALGLLQPPPPPPPPPHGGSARPARLSLERSFSAEEDQQKGLQCTLRPARVYTITPPHGMLMSSARGSKESLELEVLKERPGGRGEPHLNLNAGLGQPSASPSSTTSSPTQHRGNRGSAGRAGSHHHGNHHHGNHHHNAAPSGSGGGGSGASQHTLTVGGGGGSHHGAHGHHGHHLSQPLLQTSVSAHNIRGWGEGGGEGGGGGMAGDQASVGGSGAPSRSQGSLDLESSSREAEDSSWFPKENMFSFQTASTTMQAISNFRKHLRMVGSRRMKAQTGDLQASCAALEEGALDERMDWEEEREMERLACEGDDFIPPKIMLISSKVPKAEYVPTILRRDDPSIIPILYDHEHATFDDILEEIDKKLTAYRRGSKFWRMLIFCQGGPGHLYLLKNKVATFAKVEKEEDMSQFWRRLSRFMSKLNPEPNMIHIMGCYVLGNPNGEKLFQKLKNLMRPYSVEFQSPLELSSHGKEMIEMYFDFRLYRLWKTRQHSKLLDYEDLL